jgi:hypothetical protein
MRNKNSVMAVVVLVLGSLACAVPSLPVGDGALYKDNFSSDSGGWGTGTDTDSSVEITGGEFAMQIFKDNYFVWSHPGEDSLENVHVEVVAKNPGGGSGTAFGIICAHQVTDQYYYFGISSGGDYVIALTRLAKDDLFLTNNDQWANSPDITPNAASYKIGADCASDGTLTLYVDGKQIDSVQDTTFTKGDVGLFAWTGTDTSADIRFDDLVVTALKK